MPYYLFMLILVLYLSCFPNPIHACNQLDQDSLLSFSLTISPPLNWTSDLDCCLWEGIACDGNNRVSRLWLPSQGLRGFISPSILNLTGLNQLNVSHNYLSGTLPDQFFSSLIHLEIIDLSYNRLSGPLPPTDSLPITIQKLDLSSNHFNGTVQSLFFQPGWNLTAFNVSNNSFAGPIPSSICTNSASVQFLDFSFNEFSGQIPLGFGGCSKLEVLRADFNRLSGPIPSDIYKAGALQEISFPVNKLNGTIGGRIVNLTNLRILTLYGNGLTGVIPQDIGKLSNLEELLLHINLLTGTLPPSLMNCTNLKTLNLRVNWLQGELALLNFSNLAQLTTLDLGNNNFTGALPVSLYSCKSLTAVRLATNQLVGQVLPDIVALQSLSFLSLSNNSLTNFTGAIKILMGCKNLSTLIISKNFYNESISVDLSGNHLTGEIPASLSSLHFLSSFSVAYNNLQGPVPTGGQFDTFSTSSFEGNQGLCGPVLHHSCSIQPGSRNPSAPNKIPQKKIIIGLILGICFGVGFTLTVLALMILSNRRILPKCGPEKIDSDSISFNSNSGISTELCKDASLVIVFPNNTDEIKNLTIFEILKATDNFNQANIIGCGGFGLVYKATLENGTKLAVKKLSGDMGLMEREFKAEVEALSTAQHKNLVSLQGYCVHDGFRLLIYSYMENGSLDYWLHEKIDGSVQLDWPTRLRIAQGASCGLAYMHQICEPHIVHRDIKSSNILLDDKFEAHVADFGLSRLILPYHTHVTTELVGTLGYIPPEYGQSWIATLRGDIYSFGIVMLELLTGKRPVEVSKPKMSRELVVWVQQMRSEGKHDEVFDPLLKGRGFEEEMSQVLDVACLCVNQNPLKRPTITEVVDWLQNVGADRQQSK
ncbi:hypothetical protein CsSME_00051892 [Camellia sinensis var. sinensis]